MSDVVDAFIAELGASGDGMAILPEGRLYVPLTAPGDSVRVALAGKRDDAMPGVATELLSPGLHRREPPCPHHAAIGKAGCGGCTLQHVDIETYRAFKLSLLEKALVRAGISAQEWAEPCWVGPGARRRACFAARHTGKAVLLGFNEHGSHAICDLASCLVLDPRIVAALPELRMVLKDILRPRDEVDVHVSLIGGALDVVLVREKPLSAPDASVFAETMEKLDIARLSWRRDERHLPEVLLLRRAPQAQFGGFAVRLPPAGFMQASAAGEKALVLAVLEGLSGCRKVADLYCGSGTFALPLAAAGMAVMAADSDAPAIAALDEAIRKAVIGGRARAVKRNLAQKPMLAAEFAGFDGAVFDPPRAGAREQVAELAKARIPRIMAVSCNPATFSRDAATLAAAGYALRKIWPVDQFPYSPHMELAGLFTRVGDPGPVTLGSSLMTGTEPN